MPDFTHFLPLELTLIVISRLNNHDIISLLEAIPLLKRDAILITDHDRSPMLFDVSNIKRERFPSPFLMTTSTDFYHKSVNRDSIKLVEISYHKHLDLLVDVTPEYLGSAVDPDCLIDFDPTTFAFLQFNDTTQRRLSLLIERLDQFAPSTKWTFGSSILGLDGDYLNTSSGKSLTVPITRLASNIMDGNKFQPPNVFESLRILRIEAKDSVQSISLPHCTDMFVHFMKRKAKKRPGMREIHIPRVEKLVIHYNGIIPVFKSVQILPDSDLSRSYTPNDGFFEIRDLENSQGNYDSSGLLNPQKFNYLEKVSHRSLDLRFLMRFSTIHLLGAPDIFVHCSSLGCSKTLVWLKSTIEPSRLLLPGARSRDLNSLLPKCESVYLIVTAPGSIVPGIDRAISLSCVDILVLAPDVNISLFLDGITSISQIRNFTIFRSPRYYRIPDDGFSLPLELCRLNSPVYVGWSRWFPLTGFTQTMRFTGVDVFTNIPPGAMVPRSSNWNDCCSIFVKFNVSTASIFPNSRRPSASTVLVVLPSLNCRFIHFIDVFPIVHPDVILKFPDLTLFIWPLHVETWDGRSYFDFRAPVGFFHYVFMNSLLQYEKMYPQFLSLLKHKFPELSGFDLEFEVVLHKWSTPTLQTSNFGLPLQNVNGNEDPIYLCYVPAVRVKDDPIAKVYDVPVR